MKNTKAQTSLEFLMTYGWALIIILVVLLVAWQMGLFNPRSIQPGYSGFWGVVPGDFSLKSDGVSTLTLSVKNEVGASVNITRMNVTIGEEKSVTPELNIPVNSGENYQRDFPNFSPLPLGSRFEAFISIDYEDDRSGETYRSSGKIWGQVEAV